MYYKEQTSPPHARDYFGQRMRMRSVDGSLLVTASWSQKLGFV